MSGRRPIEFIQAASPIVIIDEPQSVDNTEKSRRAIGNLNPMATLRYSATHRNPYNLLYKLDRIKAYDLRLVKRIEVASVRSTTASTTHIVKLLKTDNTNGIKAQLEFHEHWRVRSQGRQALGSNRAMISSSCPRSGTLIATAISSRTSIAHRDRNMSSSIRAAYWKRGRKSEGSATTS